MTGTDPKITVFDFQIFTIVSHHSSISNPSVASPTSQLILQPFRRFTDVTSHSPTLPSVHLRHSSSSNPSVASPTSHLIIQPSCRFTYVTAQSPTLPSLHLRYRHFTYVTWRAVHVIFFSITCRIQKFLVDSQSVTSKITLMISNYFI